MMLKEKVLILRTIKHGESDLIVHGLNPLGARMGFFARGALKSRKRFAGGVLEPTHYVEVAYQVSRSHDADPLHTLTEASLIREFSGLRTDYARLETALHLLQLVAKLGQQGVVDSPDLFNLLGNALAAAETSGNLTKLRLHFELKLLAAQGVLPPDEDFAPFLRAGLAQHERVQVPDEPWVQAQVHDHLRHYLGQI